MQLMRRCRRTEGSIVIRNQHLQPRLPDSYPSAMEEMLDIVNELDEVIGQHTRSEVHLHGHKHRATHIILSNSARQVFVQLRSMSKDTNPGLWDTSAAGHVDAGESYLDCAARELAEELGVTVAPDALMEVGRMPPTSQNGFEFVRIYCASSDDPITLEPTDIDDGRWVSPEALDQWLTESPADFAATFADIWHNTRAAVLGWHHDSSLSDQ